MSGNLPIIATLRLRLVPISLLDVKALQDFHSIPGAQRSEGPHMDSEEVAFLVDRWVSDADALIPRGMWKITLDEEMIGRIGLISLGGTLPSLSYFLDPAQQRQGFATEAAIGILKWVLSATAAEGVEAATDPKNSSSIRVMQRLGLQRWHDACDARNERYALLRKWGTPACWG